MVTLSFVWVSLRYFGIQYGWRRAIPMLHSRCDTYVSNPNASHEMRCICQQSQCFTRSSVRHVHGNNSTWAPNLKTRVRFVLANVPPEGKSGFAWEGGVGSEGGRNGLENVTFSFFFILNQWNCACMRLQHLMSHRVAYNYLCFSRLLISSGVWAS